MLHYSNSPPTPKTIMVEISFAGQRSWKIARGCWEARFPFGVCRWRLPKSCAIYRWIGSSYEGMLIILLRVLQSNAGIFLWMQHGATEGLRAPGLYHHISFLLSWLSRVELLACTLRRGNINSEMGNGWWPERTAKKVATQTGFYAEGNFTWWIDVTAECDQVTYDTLCDCWDLMNQWVSLKSLGNWPQRHCEFVELLRKTYSSTPKALCALISGKPNKTEKCICARMWCKSCF